VTAHVLASRPGFRLLSRQAAGSASRLEIKADRDESPRLERLVAAHQRAAFGFVPGASLGVRDGKWVRVRFDCGGVATLETVLTRADETGTKVPHVHGIALMRALLETLCRLQTSPPTRIGALCPDNIVIDETGRFHLLGLGDNILALDDLGRPRAIRGLAIAPEVATGWAPTAGSDLYAITLFARTMIPYTEFSEQAQRIFGNEPLDAREREAAQLFLWSTLAILASTPERRPTPREALARAERAWELLDLVPDEEGLRRSFVSLACPEPASARRRPRLSVRRDGSQACLPDGRPVSLSNRRSLKLILLALCEARSRGRAALSKEDLIRAGWPGERALVQAAAARLYVALCELRKLGFAPVIERYDAGWRLSSDVDLQWDES
jgi:hypothetical protein